MLKFVAVGLCFAVLILESESIIVGKAKVPKDPAHPNSCVIDDGRTIVPVGQATQLPQFCGVVTCEAGATENNYEFKACPSPILGAKSCTWTRGDKTKPFPQCCDIQKCPRK